jgi:hypothetical protein
VPYVLWRGWVLPRLHAYRPGPLARLQHLVGLTVAEYAREFRAGDRGIVQHFKRLLITAPLLVIPRVGKYVSCSEACDTG